MIRNVAARGPGLSRAGYVCTSGSPESAARVPHQPLDELRALERRRPQARLSLLQRLGEPFTIVAYVSRVASGMQALLRSSELETRRRQNFETVLPWLRDSLPVAPSRDWVVLEAGHGPHGWSDLYAEHFETVYGADIEDYSSFHPGVISIQCDFTREIPLPEDSVDLLVCHSVLEHVADVRATIHNFDRVLRVGGFTFLTVNPLYYSAAGSHIYHPERLENWEHLDPASPHYLLENPLPDAVTKGHTLNRLTWSTFLAAVGTVPWTIVRSRLQIDERSIPSYVDLRRWTETDLRISEFYMLAQKQWHRAAYSRH